MIKPDDVVMVVRGHDCTVEAIGGIPFKVEAIGKSGNGEWHCKQCNSWNIKAGPEWAKIGHSTVPLSWLKKLEPETDESIVRELQAA